MLHMLRTYEGRIQKNILEEIGPEKPDDNALDPLHCVPASYCDCRKLSCHSSLN